MSLFTPSHYAKHQLPWGLLPTTGTVDDYPLVQARCQYRLVDVYLSADLHHTYTSTAHTQADVTYALPLPPDSSVHAFEAYIDGHVVKGIVQEKSQARATFETAVSMNQKAALLQQENVEIFKMMLGNVMPGHTVTVRISFVSLISHEGINDNMRLTFPTSIAPRYGIPPGDSFYRANPNLSRASTLEFSLSVELGATITTINSPSHPISSQLGRSRPEDEDFDVQKAYISLSSTTFLEKDIVVVLGCRGLDKQRCVVESHVADNGEATDAYAFTFVPRFKLPVLQQQEYIFLVDRSGSMEGGKIHAVRSALQIMLKSLPNAGSSLNMISFGSHQTAHWHRSVPYTATNVSAAAEHVDGMIANYGGTEMKRALAAAFGARGSGATSVFVLTDGQCYDLDGVQAEIRHHVERAKQQGSFVRVFCMGIGDAVSKGMCNVIARAGNGAAVFVGEAEKPDQKLMSLIKAASGPPIEDLSVDWGISNDAPAFDPDDDMDGPAPAQDAPLSMFDEDYDLTKDLAGPDAGTPGVQQYPPPALMSTLLPGFRVSFYAIATRTLGSNMARSSVIRLTATIQGKPLVLEAPVSPVAPVTAGTGLSPKLIHLIAARALIQGHEDQLPVTDVAKDAVLRLGLQFGLASSQTSFVAVDEAGEAKAFLFEEQMYGAPKASTMPSFGARARASANSGMSQLPQLRTMSASTGSATLASPALSTLSLHPQQHPIIERYLAGDNDVVSSPVQEKFGFGQSPIFASPPKMRMERAAAIISADRFSGAPLRAPAAAPPPLAFSRRGVSKKRQSSGDSVASPSSRTGSLSTINTAVDRTLTSSVESLAREQAFDGSFKPTQALFQLLTGEAIPSLLPVSLKALDIDDAVKSTVWSTLLTVAYLRLNFIEEAEVWSILSDKAYASVENSLLGQHVSQDRVSSLIKEVEEAAKNTVVKK